MRYLLLVLMLCLSTLFASAQSCPCTEQFDWLRQKLALNYSGYRDKVTSHNQAEFDRHTVDFREKINQAQSDTACLRLMRDWAQWFRDGHVQLYQKTGAVSDNPVEIRQRFADWENIALSETEARAHLDQDGRDPVEGIYDMAGGNYRVALVRRESARRDFAAVILQADSVWWMPGQVKFELRQNTPATFDARFFMRDHSMRDAKATFDNGKLTFSDLGPWHKQYPGTPSTPEKPQIFTLKQLDAQTLLLTVPTMNETVRLELDSLVKANASLLEQTENLIIDCRNNGGGSDITFYPLRPYILTGSVKGYRGQIYATEDNVEKYDRLSKDKGWPKKYRRQFARIARKMRRNMGGYFGKCGEATMRLKKMKPYPKRVAILINGYCASSCEQFVYYAEQSNRVTLIGQNTAGIMDYGNLHNLDFPCGQFGLAYPTSRSCRVEIGKAIDGTGIAPDIRLDEKEKDWVEYARQYLSRK
ncbi:MAG: hypothetical protein KF734_09030 [Saprospiraceae bacterium]|nr:hypothetical protein [Saprospiraceae bacterium]